MQSDLNEPCNIGNPHELSMNALANEINTILQNPAGVVFKPLPKDDPTRRRPNLAKAKKHLGWSPKIPFSEGIANTIAYFQQYQQSLKTNSEPDSNINSHSE